jgi:uncharacterized protein with GYD domain
MPRYMIQASYTAEAIAALVSKPQDRTQGVRALLEKLGGQLDSFEYSLGEYDVMATYTAPDDTTATAIALAVTAPGHLKHFKTTKLLAPQEFMQAQQQAGGANYQAPSRG